MRTYIVFSRLVERDGKQVEVWGVNWSETGRSGTLGGWFASEDAAWAEIKRRSA